MNGEAQTRLHYPLFVFFIVLMLLGAILLGRIVKDFFSEADIILTSFSYLSPGGVIHYPEIFLLRFFNVALALTALGYVGAANLEQARMRGPVEHAKLLRLCLANMIWALVFSALFLALNLPGMLGMESLADFLGGEDGAVEWAQVALFLLASVSFARVGIASARDDMPLYALVYFLLLALMCLFVVGEELDWGQRMLGFASPPFFEQNNIKGVTNLHNMLAKPTLALVYTVSAFLFSTLVPLSAWLRTQLAPGAPLTRILPGSRWIFTAVLMPAIFQYDEFYELVVAIILLAYSVRVTPGRVR